MAVETLRRQVSQDTQVQCALQHAREAFGKRPAQASADPVLGRKHDLDTARRRHTSE